MKASKRSEKDDELLALLYFNMLNELRHGKISYTDIVLRDNVRPPLRRVCRILDIDDICEVKSDDLLYRAIVRVNQMESESSVEDLHISIGRSMDKRSDQEAVYSTTQIDLYHSDIKGIQSQRPKGLTEVLDLISNSESQCDKKYYKFLHLAKLSMQDNILDTCISISPSYLSTPPEPIKKYIDNSSFLDIFNAYSSVINFNPHEESDAGSKIFIKDILLFGKDFEIYPRLMSKDDLKTIWSAVMLRSKKGGDGSVVGLDMHAFKDILIRIALFAYNKPTAKSMILNLNEGIMPSDLELIEYFCRYLHLDDQNHVRSVIKKHENNRKIPDRCTFGVDDSRIPLSSDSKRYSTTQNTQNTLNGHKEHKIQKPERIPLIRSSGSGMYNGANASALPFLKERQKMNYELQQADNQSQNLEGINNKKGINESKNISDKLNLNNKRKETKDINGGIKINTVESTLSLKVQEIFKSSRITHTPTDSDLGREDEKNNNERNSARSTIDMNYKNNMNNTTVFNITSSRIIPEQQIVLTNHYKPTLLRIFDKYCNFTHNSKQLTKSLWFFPKGNFVDMGCQRPGSECVIRLKITNSSPDAVFLDTTCSGLDAEDCRVITEPCALVSGFSKTVKVLFTVEPGDRAVVGYIEVFIACVRTFLNYSVKCPVYYRVGPHIPERDDDPCTTHNIAQLLSKATGLYKTETVNFESRKYSQNDSERFETMDFNTNRYK